MERRVFFVALLMVTLAGCTGETENDEKITGDSEVGSTSNSTNNSTNSMIVTIIIEGMEFTPTNIDISNGTTVRWINEDSMSHTATSDEGKFDSTSLEKGESFEFTFDETGSYPYHCNFHTGMKGTITVTA